MLHILSCPLATMSSFWIVPKNGSANTDAKTMAVKTESGILVSVILFLAKNPFFRTDLDQMLL